MIVARAVHSFETLSPSASPIKVRAHRAGYSAQVINHPERLSSIYVRYRWP